MKEIICITVQSICTDTKSERNNCVSGNLSEEVSFDNITYDTIPWINNEIMHNIWSVDNQHALLCHSGFIAFQKNFIVSSDIDGSQLQLEHAQTRQHQIIIDFNKRWHCLPMSRKVKIAIQMDLVTENATKAFCCARGLTNDNINIYSYDNTPLVSLGGMNDNYNYTNQRKLFINKKLLIVSISNRIYFYKIKNNCKPDDDKELESKVNHDISTVLLTEYILQSQPRIISRDTDSEDSNFSETDDNIDIWDYNYINHGLCLIDFELINSISNEYIVKLLLFGGTQNRDSTVDCDVEEIWNFSNSLLLVSFNVRFSDDDGNNANIRVYNFDERQIDASSIDIMSCVDEELCSSDILNFKENRYLACCTRNMKGDKIVVICKYDIDAQMILCNINSGKVVLFNIPMRDYRGWGIHIVGVGIGREKVKSDDELNKYYQALKQSSLVNKLNVMDFIIKRIVNHLDGYEYVLCFVCK